MESSRLPYIKESPSELSGEMKDTRDNSIQHHPHTVNLPQEQSQSHWTRESSTGRLGRQFSLSAKHSEDAKIEDNRVDLPIFAMVTREPIKKPIRVALYGSAESANKNLLNGKNCRTSTSPNNAEVVIKDVKYKLYYTVEKVQPSIIFYFPTLKLPLANLSLIEHSALFKLEYTDLEDAESAKIQMTPRYSFVDEKREAKCEPMVADKIMANLLHTFRMNYLMVPGGIQLTAEPQANRSNCCS